MTGIILGGLAIWLRVREPKTEFYSRLKRAIYTVGFLTMITGIFWLMHGLDDLAFGFMISVLLILAGLLIYTKQKYHIVEFQDLSEQQKMHNDFVMSNYSFYPYKLFVDWMLRKPKYASARNALAREEAKRNIGKGRADFVLEAVFPIAIIVVIILFATGIVK
ncbi:MAG: hypothetical protein KGL95_14160 [Patescibacteria group bacterium]|nr:hypothetical protein [Patescibacteria group bacterium]